MKLILQSSPATFFILRLLFPSAPHFQTPSIYVTHFEQWYQHVANVPCMTQSDRKNVTWIIFKTKLNLIYFRKIFCAHFFTLFGRNIAITQFWRIQHY